MIRVSIGVSCIFIRDFTLIRTPYTPYLTPDLAPYEPDVGGVKPDVTPDMFHTVAVNESSAEVK